MLSRVLPDDAREFTPFAWRSNNSNHREALVVEAQPEIDLLAVGRQLLAAEILEKERQAFEAGRREGEAKARRDADSALKEAVEKLASTAVEVASVRGELIRRAESDVVQLSVEIARRVLHREMTMDVSALDALVRAALEKLRSQEVFRLRVHPAQEQMFRSCLQRLGRDSAIEVVPDRAQSIGGALFEISRGSLDASVETQLREIERGLADQLGNRS